MFILKLIRKIGKMLRGGAGKKEILLGVLCGVLIGFNPVAGLTLVLAILMTLLLNANIGFTLLGVAIGRLLCLALAPVTFHTGYFILHNIGLESFFTRVVNTPVTALMDIEVYAMIGSLPYALVIGTALGAVLGTTVIRIREKMLEADQHEIIGKTFGNKFARVLLWLAFGKNKLSFEDEIPKQAPLMRKSGLILVAGAVLIGLVLEFFLLDLAVKNGLQSAIAAQTGAEVNIDKAHLSLAQGKLELQTLQVTNPDKLTHNMIQIDSLAADVSIGDLLRNSYVVELLSGSTLKRDVLRDKPGALIERPEKDKPEEKAKGDKDGKSLEDYFAQAEALKKYGTKAYDYLKEQKEKARTAATGEKPKARKQSALADAKKRGYLQAAADLATDRPAWVVRKVTIEDVDLGHDFPAQTFHSWEVSSHPVLNKKPTSLALIPAGGTEPTIKVVLRVNDPAALNTLTANISGIGIDGLMKTGDSFPLNVSEGKADIKANGEFSADELAVPFAITVRDLKADVPEGRTVMGMDHKTATDVFSSMEKIELDGSLGGSLLSPRFKVDLQKLTANMKDALVAAGKKELANRANKEMDKLKGQAGEELDKALQGEEAQELKSKAKNVLKNLF